jgi:hypothetical protein
MLDASWALHCQAVVSFGPSEGIGRGSLGKGEKRK